METSPVLLLPSRFIDLQKFASQNLRSRNLTTVTSIRPVPKINHLDMIEMKKLLSGIFRLYY